MLLNVAALDRGLGTGGYALVIAVLDRNGRVTAQPPQPAGHLVKARYLPLQAMVAGADEQGSEHHDLLREADSIDRMPVVVADLHSAVAPIVLAIHHDRPVTRVIYVMTDQGPYRWPSPDRWPNCGLPACWQEPSPSGRRSVAT